MRLACVACAVVVIFSVRAVAFAAELHPGDIVLFSGSGIFRLDPVTLAPTQISDHLGFGSEIHHMTVDGLGRLLITDEARGIVEVAPATGSRTILVPVETLGGPPRGITHDADGSILVTVQTTPPRVLRIASDGQSFAIVTEGGFLIAPTGLDVASDGTILVADQGLPTTDPIPNLLSIGALVRVDASTGAQTLVAADPFFQAPQEVACVSPDSVWIANRGLGLRTTGGGFTITRVSDGATVRAGPFGASTGVAVLPSGGVVLSGCVAVHGDCSSSYVSVNSTWLDGYLGTLAVVPELKIPQATTLAPAIPNPFAASTALTFSLVMPGNVELAIYSVDGRRVVSLEHGSLPAGPHKTSWDGTDDRGHLVRPGMYYARLTSAEGRFTRALVLIR
jgi:sugar lactone lactonase YvrE